jgi:hypothetical protein
MQPLATLCKALPHGLHKYFNELPKKANWINPQNGRLDAMGDGVSVWG